MANVGAAVFSAENLVGLGEGPGERGLGRGGPVQKGGRLESEGEGYRDARGIGKDWEGGENRKDKNSEMPIQDYKACGIFNSYL